MKNKPLQNIIMLSIALWLAIIIVAIAFVNEAHSAAVWTPQEGVYIQYKVGTTNKYELSTKAVPSNYIKQSGTYTQLKSSGGATKYELINVQDVNCDAFICRDDFGYTFDLTKNTVLQCPMVKITNEQIQAYEGLQSNAVNCR